MGSLAKSPDLDQSQTQEQHLDDLIPIDIEKSTGFDASPFAERQEGLSRRPTRVLDPRSPLTRLTSSITQSRNFSHPLAPQKTSSDALVDFDGPDDPYRPLNWPNRKKFITVLLFSSDVSAIGKEYHVSDIVSTLGTTLFLFGYAYHLLVD
ncbi:MAG: hypothetical protein Q9175_001983 [Cornicularia normoerica]